MSTDRKRPRRSITVEGEEDGESEDGQFNLNSEKYTLNIQPAGNIPENIQREYLKSLDESLMGEKNFADLQVTINYLLTEEGKLKLKNAFLKTLSHKIEIYKKEMESQLHLLFVEGTKLYETVTNEELLAVSSPSFSDITSISPLYQTALAAVQELYMMLKPYIKPIVIPVINNDSASSASSDSSASAASAASAASVISKEKEKNKVANLYQDLLLTLKIIPDTFRKENRKNLAYVLYHYKFSKSEKDFKNLKQEKLREILNVLGIQVPKKKSKSELVKVLQSELDLLLPDIFVPQVNGIFNMMVLPVFWGKMLTDSKLEGLFKKKYNNLMITLNKLIISVDCNNEEIQSTSNSRYTITSSISKLINTFMEKPEVVWNIHLNMILMGVAGTGKSRYAKLIGQILQNTGILISTRDVDVLSKPDLVGEFLGQSAPRTKKRLLMNLEGVIFIDEAYGLSIRTNSPGEPVKWDDYGYEVVTEIVNFLDKYKGKICVIAAGYPKQMKEDFLVINEGNPRRFPYQIMLPPYTAIELLHILCYFLRSTDINWLERFSDEAKSFLLSIMKNNYLRQKIFPNAAGDIENLAKFISDFLAQTKGIISKCVMYNLLRQFCFLSKGIRCEIFPNKICSDMESSFYGLKVG